MASLCEGILSKVDGRVRPVVVAKQQLADVKTHDAEWLSEKYSLYVTEMTICYEVTKSAIRLTFIRGGLDSFSDADYLKFEKADLGGGRISDGYEAIDLSTVASPLTDMYDLSLFSPTAHVDEFNQRVEPVWVLARGTRQENSYWAWL